MFSYVPSLRLEQCVPQHWASAVLEGIFIRGFSVDVLPHKISCNHGRWVERTSGGQLSIRSAHAQMINEKENFQFSFSRMMPATCFYMSSTIYNARVMATLKMAALLGLTVLAYTQSFHFKDFLWHFWLTYLTEYHRRNWISSRHIK